MKNYGWQGSFSEFLNVNGDELVNHLCTQVYDQSLVEARNNPLEESTLPQICAWYDSIEYLKKEVIHFQHLDGFLIFEYEIIRGDGRRPDVLLFLPGEVLVLEFKQYSKVDDPEYNQASLYIRDLESYHSAINEFQLDVRGAIIATSAQPMLEAKHDYQLYLVGQRSLRELIEKIEFKLKDGLLIKPTEFLAGVYEPLPSIIESAKSIMRDEPLPQIKTLKSSNYDHVMEEVESIVKQAKRDHTHHLILVSGVPGAGKTFVGLNLAHTMENAVYLSGNNPLVDVLQDSLQNKTFVQALYGYKMEYLRRGIIPDDNILIFDEAQRAWDAKKMKGDKSEPEVFIEIAKHKPWAVVVGLIGEGQEIHTGEEGGIGLWNDAIKGKDFNVHARHHEDLFPNSLRYYENLRLHLKTSLRTHNALKYFEWVEKIIAGNFEDAKIIQQELKKKRYTVKVVDSLEEARNYVQKIYQNTDKTYGIVVSSGIKYPKGVKVIPYSDRYVEPKNHVAYFNYPNSQYYCRNLEYAATEFHVQGLELDMAIVYWGKDLRREDDDWKVSYPKRGVEDSYQMKLNAYRVLLTRGRDGVIIYRE